MPPFRCLVLAALLLSGACRAPSSSRPGSADCHPACPGAETAGIGAEPTLRAGAPQPSDAPESAGARPPSAAAYLCPMHPDVGSDQPGRCPVCSMVLLPRAQVLEHGHGH